METHSIHMELMDAMNHINIYSAEIADTLLQSGALMKPEKDQDAGSEAALASGAK